MSTNFVLNQRYGLAFLLEGQLGATPTAEQLADGAQFQAPNVTVTPPDPVPSWVPPGWKHPGAGAVVIFLSVTAADQTTLMRLRQIEQYGAIGGDDGRSRLTLLYARAILGNEDLPQASPALGVALGAAALAGLFLLLRGRS